MSCPMCEFSRGPSGDVIYTSRGFFSGWAAYLRKTEIGPIERYELWAKNCNNDTTVTEVSYCPWCGRKLDDGKGDGE